MRWYYPAALLPFGVFIDIVDRILDGRHLLGVLVRHFNAERLLERHHQFHLVQRIRPRSSTNDAVGVTSASSTPSCSTIICFTRSSTLAIHFLRDLLSLLLVSAKVSGPPGPNAAPHAHSPRKCNLPILFAPSSKVNFAPVAQPPLRHRMRFRQAMNLCCPPLGELRASP